MTSRILVSLRVATTPGRAFEVFTRDIGEWWRPNSLFRFTQHSPGELAFEPGVDGRFMETLPNGEIFEIGRITVWEPGARLAFTWQQETFLPDQITHVEVRFEPVGQQTRITVEHRGWDTIPPSHVARHGMADAYFMRRHGEWWQTLLSSYNVRLG